MRTSAALLGMVLTAVALVGCGGSGPGTATSTTAGETTPWTALVQPAQRYVAMGSSFASGPGLQPGVDAGCGRSSVNYASLVAERLLLDLNDVSCAAATTDNIIVGRQDTGDRQRALQIAAVDPQVRLVTLTIGGNDVGYATLLDDYSCLDGGRCADVVVDDASVYEAVDTVTPRLVSVIDAIRERAPDAVVVLVTYPQIVPRSGETCPALSLSPEHARVAAEIGDRLHEAFLVAAERTGARLVDPYAVGDGHSACAGPDAWVSGWNADEDRGGVRSFHPTLEGMRAQADLIVTSLTGR